MFTVKFVGGAKKSFPMERLNIDKSEITIQELIILLVDLKPKDTPTLDTENVLIAINGADSSAMSGKSTKIKDNDIVSIIPIIHGGALNRLTFEFSKKQIQAIEIKDKTSINVQFLDELRKKFPKLVIQAISSDFILNQYHFKKIISLSIESQKNNVLLSNKLETDILMRFALNTQISNAIKNVGIKSNKSFVLVAIGNKKNLNSLYVELKPFTVNLFLKNNELYLRKYFKITKKHFFSTYSKNPLADILIEKASVLF
ncbi:KEOPS complex subunit Cgi121 [Nitrosopumilus sp.]|uniref:KEOPS complex subunit Cgi121 n=1 Tax=Nitrosopumilus sp. TaxID=2024843 RepID=UPI00247BFE86|nr:KEOPS complex subunit Cgi121 [Nitrosopumilus sp.]MCV0431738.1 MoaD/ThiS family protein [Nitrosopumilus sp.]